jgi:beta-lactam-binding protein with PASTA domain
LTPLKRNTLGTTPEGRRDVKRALIVALGAVLVVVLYSAASLTRVPAVSGTDEQAATELIQAGFKVVEHNVPGNYPQELEVVVSQSPAAGSLRPFGSTVEIWTRLPRASVTVPEVAGMPVSRASQVIVAAGLIAEPDVYHRPDAIVKLTSPSGGVTVPFGSRVQCVTGAVP